MRPMWNTLQLCGIIQLMNLFIRRLRMSAIANRDERIRVEEVIDLGSMIKDFLLPNLVL